MWVLLGTTLLVALILAFGRRLGWWRTVLALIVLVGLLALAAYALARVLADTLTSVAPPCHAQAVLTRPRPVPADREHGLVLWHAPIATSHRKEAASCPFA